MNVKRMIRQLSAFSVSLMMAFGCVEPIVSFAEDTAASEPVVQADDGMTYAANATAVEFAGIGQTVTQVQVYEGDPVMNLEMTLDKEYPANTALDVWFSNGQNSTIVIGLTNGEKGGNHFVFSYSSFFAPPAAYGTYTYTMNQAFIYATGDTQFISVADMDTYTFTLDYKEETTNIDVQFYSMTETGTFALTREGHLSDVTYQTGYTASDLAAAGLDVSYPVCGVEGVTQTGWGIYLENNGVIDIEDVPVSIKNGSLTLYAMYDKPVVPVIYQYLNTNNQFTTVAVPVVMDSADGKNVTYGDLKAKIQSYVPEDACNEQKITGWNVDNLFNRTDDEQLSYVSCLEDQINNSYNPYFVYAEYGENIAVNVNKYYFDDKGNFTSESETVMIADGSSTADLIEEMNAEGVPSIYDGLQFTGWSLNNGTDTTLTNGAFISLVAHYDKALVRLIVYGSEEDAATNDINKAVVVSYMVMEEGTTFGLGPILSDYVNLVWKEHPYAENGVVTVHEGIAGNHDFIAVGEKAGTTPTIPSGSPEERPSQEVINEALAIITNVPSDVVGAINLHGYTTVTKEMLEAAKGRDITLYFSGMGQNIGWTIRGKDITAEQCKDVNLHVEMNTSDIPASLLKELAGDHDTIQFKFPLFSGDFGFKTTMPVYAGIERAGQYGNLFCYTEDGNLEYVTAVTVSEIGFLDFDLTHASSYVIVLADHDMKKDNVGVETGNYNSPTGYAAAILVCVALGAFLIKKRHAKM